MRLVGRREAPPGFNEQSDGEWKIKPLFGLVVDQLKSVQMVSLLKTIQLKSKSKILSGEVCCSHFCFKLFKCNL